MNEQEIREAKLRLQIPPVQICGPWLCESHVVMLYAKRGLAKTFVCLRLLLALLEQAPFLRWSPTRKTFRVGFIDGEMGRDALYSRLNLMDPHFFNSEAAHRFDLRTFEDCPNQIMKNLSDPADQPWFTNQIKPWDVVVLDNLLSLSNPLDKRDDDVTQWTRIKPWLVKMRAAGKCIILVHHAGKSGDQLGTSVRENLMDNVIQIRRSLLSKPDNGVALEWHFTKCRFLYGRDEAPLYFEILTDNCGTAFHWHDLQDRRRIAVLGAYRRVRNKRSLAQMFELPLSEITEIIDNDLSNPEPEEPPDEMY